MYAVAMELPDLNAYVAPGVVVRTSVPGARIPKVSADPAVPIGVPTAMTSSIEAGKDDFDFGSTAATNTIPLSLAVFSNLLIKKSSGPDRLRLTISGC